MGKKRIYKILKIICIIILLFIPAQVYALKDRFYLGYNPNKIIFNKFSIPTLPIFLYSKNHHGKECYLYIIRQFKCDHFNKYQSLIFDKNYKKYKWSNFINPVFNNKVRINVDWLNYYWKSSIWIKTLNGCNKYELNFSLNCGFFDKIEGKTFVEIK